MKSALSKTKLYDFITKEMIDIPLIAYSPDETIGLMFDNIASETAIEIVQQILKHLLSTDPFWVCEYGTDNGETFLENHFFSREPTIEVLEYHSMIDRDYIEYEKDAIACVQTALPVFSLDAYIRCALRPDGLSNNIFLINPDKGFAVWIYDERGMYITSKDANLRLELQKKCIYSLRSTLGVSVQYHIIEKSR